MAIIRATKNGNWSDATVWAPSAPTSADDVYSNTFTVTIDTSPTVLRVSNASTTGVTQGGTFVPSNGITLTCTGAGVVSATGTCITSSLTAGQSFNVVGSVSVVAGVAITNTGAGGVNVTGNVTAGGVNAHAITNSGAGPVSVTGDVTGGTSNLAYGINNTSTGAVTVIGGLIASVGSAYNATLTSTLTHSGTATAANNAPAISSSSTGASVTVTGPFLVSANGTHAIFCPNWRWSSSTPVSYYQVRTAVSGAIRTLFTADSVAGVPAASNVRSGTVYGPSNELTGTCAVPPAGSVALGVPVDNTTGTAVLTQANFQAALDAQGLTSSRATKLDNLDDTVSSRLASASYTAPLDAAGTRTAIGLATANLDSQLDALPTAVENASAVRTELATELGRIDVATSTRSTFNPATDTVAQVTLVDTTTNLTNPPDVPTTSEIADAVRIELTPELDRIDADVSSRLASIDYTTPPTALENAQAVEVQLSLPLGNLDVAVSTRSTFDPVTDIVANVTLVDTTTNLTNPPVVPTPEQIAAAVRVELEPELSRVENCATVATTGQQIQNALSV